MKFPIRKKNDPVTGDDIWAYRGFDIRPYSFSSFKYQVKLTQTKTVLGKNISEMKELVDGRIKEREATRARYEARKQGCK